MNTIFWSIIWNFLFWFIINLKRFVMFVSIRPPGTEDPMEEFVHSVSGGDSR